MAPGDIDNLNFDFYQIVGVEASKQANFSSLCSRLILALEPDAKPVEGKGGDQGLDTFLGEFNAKLRAYQHKYFLEKLGQSQKRQILKSIQTADSHHKVESWVLMIPRDLNPAEIKWFASLARKFRHIQMDWWGKTKLQSLLGDHPGIAREFQPPPNIMVVVVQDTIDIKTATLEDLAHSVSKSAGIASQFRDIAELQEVLIATASELKRRIRLRVLLYGPSSSTSDIYAKRQQIRGLLEQLGHVVHYGEDVCTPELLMKTGLNLSVAELIQARRYDYIIVLMASPGVIGEVHDFAGRREFAAKMMICVDFAHHEGYSAQGILRRFEGLNGKLHWFRYPMDVTDCHLASRVLDQIVKVAETKHWELAVGSVLP